MSSELDCIKGDIREKQVALALLLDTSIKLKPTRHTRTVMGWEGVGLNLEMIEEMNNEEIKTVSSVDGYVGGNIGLFEVKIRADSYVYPFSSIQEII